MAMAWKQMFSHRTTLSTRPDSLIGFFRFFSKPSQYVEKVGIPEFLNGVGKGVETHVAKLETEIGDFNKLLVTRTLRLKKFGIPCKHPAEGARVMAMAWKQMFSHRSTRPDSLVGFFRFFSKPSQYVEKVGIPEFLNGVGRGVETHVAKLETEIGDFNKLLVTRTLRLKKLGIPCKHRKLILKYTHKYRLGLWRPRAEAIKS